MHNVVPPVAKFLSRQKYNMKEMVAFVNRVIEMVPYCVLQEQGAHFCCSTMSSSGGGGATPRKEFIPTTEKTIIDTIIRS